MRCGRFFGIWVAAFGAVACGSSKKADLDPPVILESTENAVPFEGGAYVVVNDQDPSGAVHRFWPTEKTGAYVGFDQGSTYFGFRPNDGQLFYSVLGRGILFDDAVDKNDTVVPAPPCTMPVGPYAPAFLDRAFGFDGQGALHYDCNAEIRRGDGVLIHTPSALSGVLADGRVLLVEGDGIDQWTSRFVVRNAAGELMTKLDLPLHDPMYRATTVQGNDAFVLLARYDSMTDADFDILMYRLDSSSAWLPMRTLPRPMPTEALALSDGTVFARGDKSIDDRSPIVTAYLSDGRKEVVWEGTPQDSLLANYLLVGPREPGGPSFH